MTKRCLIALVLFKIVYFSAYSYAGIGNEFFQETIHIKNLEFLNPKEDLNTLMKKHRDHQQELRRELREAPMESLDHSVRTIQEVLEELWLHISKTIFEASEADESDKENSLSAKSLPAGIALPTIYRAPTFETTNTEEAEGDSDTNSGLSFATFQNPSTLLSPVTPLNPLLISPYARGQLLFPKNIPPYTQVQKLGYGAIGVVFLVQNQETEEKFALKEIELGPLTHKKFQASTQNQIQRQAEKLMVEPRVLDRLSGHPNIAHLIGYYKDSTHLRIAMKYAPGTTLGKGSCLSELAVRKIMSQLLSALQYSHSMAIAHLDVKPQNIIWDEQEEHATLIDFSEARFFRPEAPILDSHLPPGTLAFRRPGIVNVIQIDLVALGKTCELLLGNNMSQGARDFIDDCLSEKSPQIQNLRQHYWFETIPSNNDSTQTPETCLATGT